jgi:hypothetical protein
MKRNSGSKNGAAESTAKTSKVSGKEIKSGAGMLEAHDLQSIVLLNQTDDGENCTGDGIWMDAQGQCYLGSYSAPRGYGGNPQPIAPKRVLATEALRWFSKHDEDSIDGEGSIAPIIKAALNDELWPQAHLTIQLRTGDYGACCEAGVVHNCTPGEALSKLLGGNDFLMEWANHDFSFDVDLLGQPDATMDARDRGRKEEQQTGQKLMILTMEPSPATYRKFQKAGKQFGCDADDAHCRFIDSKEWHAALDAWFKRISKGPATAA